MAFAAACSGAPPTAQPSALANTPQHAKMVPGDHLRTANAPLTVAATPQYDMRNDGAPVLGFRATEDGATSEADWHTYGPTAIPGRASGRQRVFPRYYRFYCSGDELYVERYGSDASLLHHVVLKDDQGMPVRVRLVHDTYDFSKFFEHDNAYVVLDLTTVDGSDGSDRRRLWKAKVKCIEDCLAGQGKADCH